MPDTVELTRILGAQPRPDCAALTPFTIESADFERGRVVLRFRSQPAFGNHFDNVQGGFAVAMADVLVSLAAFAKTKAWLPTIDLRFTPRPPQPFLHLWNLWYTMENEAVPA